MMSQEKRYVDFFYQKYQGRVALSAGYAEGLIAVFPFVFTDGKGDALGGIALTPLDQNDTPSVYIYHLSSFNTHCGDGGTMLSELCLKADEFNITLSLSPITLPNGNDDIMDSVQLKKWYEQYGFSGEEWFRREPRDKGGHKGRNGEKKSIVASL